MLACRVGEKGGGGKELTFGFAGGQGLSGGGGWCGFGYQQWAGGDAIGKGTFLTGWPLRLRRHGLVS